MVPPGKDDAVPTGSDTVVYGSQSEKPIVGTVLNEEEGKITKLLLDLLKPYNGSFRTVNMDRFYNGSLAAVSMLQKGLLRRGTFKTSRRFAPTSIIRFSDSDSNRFPRGSYRMAVAVKEHMSIFGWNYGCGVHTKGSWQACSHVVPTETGQLPRAQTIPPTRHSGWIPGSLRNCGEE
eukprot:scaffold48127_cov62-Attheya_sp.AAC.1